MVPYHRYAFGAAGLLLQGNSPGWPTPKRRHGTYRAGCGFGDCSCFGPSFFGSSTYRLNPTAGSPDCLYASATSNIGHGGPGLLWAALSHWRCYSGSRMPQTQVRIATKG